MKAQELRIGNYVYYNDKVISIAPNAINEFYYIGDTHSESLVDRRCYKPIELTEEILLKCGFDLKSIPFHAIKGQIILSTFRGVWAFKHVHIEIKHLHQLQNLYFALTGEELEIDLLK